jgi:predicted MFS family arabinose efflux permease
MNLLISIPAALLGSLVGSAVRGGVGMAHAQLGGRLTRPDDPAPSDEPVAAPPENAISINGSAVAALVGGAVGSLLGVRTAFWVGAVLGAAGVDRLDAMLLGRVGIDMDALVAKASEAATEAASRARSAATDESA